MTNRERQGLIAALRMLSLSNPTKWGVLNVAADEIERLVKEKQMSERRS